MELIDIDTERSNNAFAQPFGCNVVSTGENENTEVEEVDDPNQVTPQSVVDSLSRYTVRRNGAYLHPGDFCGICYSKYHIGDRVICLPCCHNFHEYCIENWLKWVKSTCPIDKKRVIRGQYMEDVLNERRNRLFEAHAQNKINIDPNCSEEDSFSSDSETNIPDEENRKKILKTKRDYQKVQEIKDSRECTAPQLLSFKDRVKSDAKNEIECREKNLGVFRVFPYDYSQRLRDSVVAIRKSIKSNEPKLKKVENSEVFEKALNSTINKLSEMKIPSDSAEEASNGSKKCKNPRSAARRSIFSKSKNDEKLSLRDRRNLTFGDILEIENQVNSGWIYKRNNQAFFSKEQ